MTDLDRLLFLHYCKKQAEKQDDIPFSSTKEYDDLKSEVEQAIKDSEKWNKIGKPTIKRLQENGYSGTEEVIQQIKKLQKESEENKK